MRLLKTFKDAASQEIAWFNAYSEAKNNGFTHVVNVVSVGAGLQKHYFKSLEKANDFYLMAKDNKEYWLNPSKPFTINSALKQCWS